MWCKSSLESNTKRNQIIGKYDCPIKKVDTFFILKDTFCILSDTSGYVWIRFEIREMHNSVSCKIRVVYGDTGKTYHVRYGIVHFPVSQNVSRRIQTYLDVSLSIQNV
jgi:hypothetical protein